ncbi:polycomb group protein ASXL1 isoform X2 [Rhineura floridana]|uniref:polycomb group protein ASXL1 isoform X2 n=1 Tax=Rhineura floridana TaxID=261503 RepID=UPI002AC851DC|nr:polycomb group protein ASXL1 isoform X2 [Rhineura floridana]
MSLEVRVLENYSDGPMTPKQILQVIETEGLKEMSGTSPLACLNAMLHSNSRSCDGLFYKLPGRISLFTLKKDAVQWSRNLSAPEGEELEDGESSSSNEASPTSGDHDVSLDDTSSSASCSTETQSKSVPAVRECHRAASQASKQKKKTGVMLPRVVLTPLKVNGAHMETSSASTGRQGGGESSSSSSSALCSTALRSRTEIARDAPQLLRGFRKPTSGQMKRNRGEDVDFETPGSILVNTNLRALINSRTFSALPLHFQQQLLLLLPEVDRQAGTDGLMRLSGSALNNEFFTHAAQSWRERLADGEFTHEMQMRLRQEMEKEKRTEQWKERFFEDYYGQKLGLTREEPPQQKAAPDDTENRTTSVSQEEPASVQRGPVTRQRDGRFKKRALRCRTRGSLNKLCQAEQAEAARETLAMKPDSPSRREMKPEVDLCERSRLFPKSEIPSEATRILSKVDVMSVATASGRIPSFSQEPHDQESKEQKRKCFEQAASASFPEKKPRLEDRQSFRNTIESVHPEKPQPTKEEPKVPPIRIQLSRIKPPWVVKGQPAYQIRPRVIPDAEPSSQDRNRDSASADVKACAVQSRIQREAAAPATAIGGGGGPGGGGRSTDEGGGGGGRRIRQPSNHPKCWRSKRTRRKCVSDLQRTQLLSPSHLEEETSSELTKTNLPAYEQEASEAEEALAFGQAASLTSLGAECAVQLAEAAGGSHLGDAVTDLPLGCIATETPLDSAGQLSGGLSCEPPPSAASQEGDDRKEGSDFPPSGQRSLSWLQGPPVNPLERASRMEGHERGDALILSCSSPVKEATSVSSSRTIDLESSEEDGLDVVPGSHAEEHLPDPDQENSSSIGMELASQWRGREMASGLHSSSKNEASLSKPVPLSEGVNPSHGSLASKSCLPPWEVLLRTGAGTGSQQAQPVPSTNPSSDEETRSMLSETTETASDLEAELMDENAELDWNGGKATEKGADPNRGHLGEYNGIRFEGSVRTDTPSCREDLPSEAGTTNVCQPQCWRPQPSLLQEACESSPHVDLQGQERPLVETPKHLSVQASNPRVVPFLRGRLPLKTVLSGAQSSTNIAAAASSLARPSSKCGSFPVANKTSLSQKLPSDEGMDAPGTVRNGYCAPRSLRDFPKGQGTAGPTSLPVKRVEKEPKGLGKSPPLSSKSDAPASTSQRPDKLGLRGGTVSPCPCEDQPDSSAAVPAESVAGGSPKGKLEATATPCVAPCVGPDSVPKSHGAHGKKVFGSSFPCSATARVQQHQHHKGLEPFPMLGMLSHSKLVPPPKTAVSGSGMQAVREDWPPKQRLHAGGGRGVENKNVLVCSSPAKRNVEKRKEASPSPVELVEQHLQSIPLGRDLPFFKLPREPGKGLAQPLEPSSVPSQLNIKQAFYGKLSKLQLNSASFNYASNVPVFPRSLAGSMMQLNHKANFAASRGVSFSAQMFADSSSMEEISLKCSCSLKAMIMCKGCGAFCHDDCIGPSKLCVLCLVVR